MVQHWYSSEDLRKLKFSCTAKLSPLDLLKCRELGLVKKKTHRGVKGGVRQKDRSVFLEAPYQTTCSKLPVETALVCGTVNSGPNKPVVMVKTDVFDSECSCSMTESESAKTYSPVVPLSDTETEPAPEPELCELPACLLASESESDSDAHQTLPLISNQENSPVQSLPSPSRLVRGGQTSSVTIGLLNAQSCAQKAVDIHDCVLDSDLDVFCVTETWLKETGDETVIAEMTPAGYSFIQAPRSCRAGGGIALFYKSHLVVKRILTKTSFVSFEYLWITLTVGKLTIKLVCIYHPPPSARNKIKFAGFLEDFTQLSTSVLAASEYALFLGDFNVHFDNPQHNNTKRMMELLSGSGMCQHVASPTHIKGHILDWVVSSPSATRLLKSVTVTDLQISDHFLVTVTTDLTRQPVPKKTIRCRNLKNMDHEAFRADLSSSGLLRSIRCDVEKLVQLYNETLSELIDRHAPETTKRVPDRPGAWFSEGARQAKHERRRAEQVWRKSGLEVHRQMYRKARNLYREATKRAKKTHTLAKLEGAASDPKKVHEVVKQLQGKDGPSPVLPELDNKTAAERLSTFFSDKIQNIRSELDLSSASSPVDPVPFCGNPFSTFIPVTEQELKKIINKSKTTSSSVDPVPTRLVLQHLDVLLPVILNIVNSSLKQGIVPNCFKSAVVKPLIKKSSLDPSSMSSFRPVSNLPYLSKILERVVTEQLTVHLHDHRLLDRFQSAYRAGFSTETALLRIMSDMLCLVNSGKVVLLTLLDLSAAFDTIDHAILLQRLSVENGVSGIVHKWFESYLTNRFQHVKVGLEVSSSVALSCGVPQGSVLGPVLFSIYITPLGRVIDQFNIQRQQFADDTQLQTSFLPDESSASAAVQNLESCCDRIKSWMAVNRLKLNDNKTEAILCGPQTLRQKVPIEFVRVGDATICLSDTVRDLGLVIDSSLDMTAHISSVVRSCYCHLRSLGKLRPYLTQAAANTIAVSLILSRLDYCNSALWGLPAAELNRLQKLQNAAARIVTRTKPSEHITPVLKKLHWLPVNQRIKHKILSLAYKCLHNNAPDYLQELVPPYVPARCLRSSSLSRLAIPGYYENTNKKRSGARSFRNAAPMLWNSLPEALRTTPSLQAFRRGLKSHLFLD